MNSLFDAVCSSLGSLMMFFLWVPCLEFALEPHHLLKMILPKMFFFFSWVLSFFGQVLPSFSGYILFEIECKKLEIHFFNLDC